VRTGHRPPRPGSDPTASSAHTPRWHAFSAPTTTELRTLAAYVEALGGRLEIIADFGDQRLAFIEPGTEAA
jgi:hypothetical protein